MGCKHQLTLSIIVSERGCCLFLFEKVIWRVVKASCPTHFLSFCLIFCVLVRMCDGHGVHCVCIACTIKDSANQGSVLTSDLNTPITASVRNRWDGHLCSGLVKVIDLHLFNYKWARDRRETDKFTFKLIRLLLREFVCHILLHN